MVNLIQNGGSLHISTACDRLKMSIPFSGTITRSGGVASAIGKQLKFINLKPAKKINIKFDPFHQNVTPTREFLFHISSQKVLGTNLNCSVKTEILCDRSEPSIAVHLVNGESVIFKSGNLSTLELLQLYNKHVTPLAPVEDLTAKVVKTKSEKAAATKTRRR